MACKACEGLNIEDLFTQASLKPNHLVLHTSYELLEAAAKDGCSTCNTFQTCFRNNFVNLKEKVAQLEHALGISPPVVVFLQMAFGENWKRPINKFHVQIGSDPERPGVEQFKISFRVSKTWGTVVSMLASPYLHSNILYRSSE